MVSALLFMYLRRASGVINSLFSMTMTTNNDRYRLRLYWVGHGGHGGHGNLHTHTYTRAHERPRINPINYLVTLPYVYKNTMTTMTSMTRLVIARASAVTVGGHSNKQGDHAQIAGGANDFS